QANLDDVREDLTARGVGFGTLGRLVSERHRSDNRSYRGCATHVRRATMAADSPWPLRLDLISAKALVWVASVGRDAELTRDAHIFFFDRYQRLAQFHKRHGHEAAFERLQAKA